MPIVAVLPNASPPVTVAKTVQSIGCLFGRRLGINMITGAAPKEMEAVGDRSEHQDRYERLFEYTTALRILLESDSAVTFEGKHYTYRNLQLKPTLPSSIQPLYFIAGSSESGRNTARTCSAVWLTHPEPLEQYRGTYSCSPDRTGIRIGIIARRTDQEAWTAAEERFQPSRFGLALTAAGRKSPSHWIRSMAQLAERELYDGVYWMGAYRSGAAHNPYFVGSYDRVAEYMRGYIEHGVRQLGTDPAAAFCLLPRPNWAPPALSCP
ncbi:LLM class flavin-dependent oxidoreductase [Paenibacillus antri]|uniref:LLM class flavin-dependent oxidoreductase n=1 Tax=Paenibacillus antri TaxID=2582848 RepID=UPI003F6D8C5A